jgi:hypothetical protein
MKKDYWNLEDKQVIEKTGKKIAEWITVLDGFKAVEKKSMMWFHFCNRNITCQDIWREPYNTLP